MNGQHLLMVIFLKPLTICHARRRCPAWPRTYLQYSPDWHLQFVFETFLITVDCSSGCGLTHQYGVPHTPHTPVRCPTHTTLKQHHIPNLSTCNVAYCHISWQTPCSTADTMSVYRTLDVWFPYWHQAHVSMAIFHLYNTSCSARGINMKGKRMTLTWRHLVARCFVTIVMGILASWCIGSSYCLVKVVRRLTHLQLI